MRTWLIVIIALLLFAVPERAAVAGDEAPVWVQQAATLKVPSYDKEVAAVVLVNERMATVAADGRITETVNYAVRVLQREGRG